MSFFLSISSLVLKCKYTFQRAWFPLLCALAPAALARFASVCVNFARSENFHTHSQIGRGCAPWGTQRNLVKLFCLGRTGQSNCRGSATGDHLGHFVEVAGADLALVFGGGVAEFLQGELGLLEF